MGGKGFDKKSISIRLYVDVKLLLPSHLIVNEETESFLQYLLSFNNISASFGFCIVTGKQTQQTELISKKTVREQFKRCLLSLHHGHFSDAILVQCKKVN